MQGQAKHAGRQAVGLGALGVDFGLDVVIPSLFGQFCPVGVDQERLAQGNELCPAGGQCLGSLGCGVEVAHADEGQLAADVLMQLFDAGALRICAATGFLVEVPQGDVQVLQRFPYQGIDEGEGVGHGDAVLAGFFGREAVADDEFGFGVPVAHGRDGVHDGQRETQPVLQAAAPGISPAVGLGGEELLDQVVVGAVDFHAIKAGFQRQFGGAAIAVNDAQDLRFVQGLGAGFGMLGRGEDLAIWVELGNGLPTAVMDLQQGFGALVMGNAGDFAQAGQVFGADGLGLSVEGLAALVHQGGRRNEQADAPEAVSEELTLLGGDVAVVVRGQMGHRGDGQAVADGDAVVEGVALEEVRMLHGCCVLVGWASAVTLLYHWPSSMPGRVWGH